MTQLPLVIGGSIVNVALPQIQKELHFTPSGPSWSSPRTPSRSRVSYCLVGKSIGMGATRSLMIGSLVFIKLVAKLATFNLAYLSLTGPRKGC
jgi:hypothetical protein